MTDAFSELVKNIPGNRDGTMFLSDAAAGNTVVRVRCGAIRRCLHSYEIMRQGESRHDIPSIDYYCKSRDNHVEVPIV